MLQHQLAIPDVLAPAKDQLVGHFSFLSSLAALGKFSSGRAWISAAVASAFAAAHRVSDRVHRCATNMRAYAKVAGSSCLAKTDTLVFDIAQLSDRRTADRVDDSHLAGRKDKLGLVALSA